MVVPIKRSALVLSIFMAAAALLVFAVPARVNAQMSIGISVGYAPPALPQYYQPAATQPNMIWQPGYWGLGQGGFFWVPGTWVQAPQVGLLWTPGYWGWNDGQYRWSPGYWGQNVGYYGGINYGYGYYGQGYQGGRWEGKSFRYNTSVTHVNRSLSRNDYYSDPRSYVDQNDISRTSYNGGPHGVAARPSKAQIAVEHQRTYPMTSAQTAHVAVSRQNRSYYANVNHGSPGQVAVPKPFTPSNRPVGAAATARCANAVARTRCARATACRFRRKAAAASRQRKAAPIARTGRHGALEQTLARVLDYGTHRSRRACAQTQCRLCACEGPARWARRLSA
jgi:WXXGXW repeat (2 copies)